MPALQTVCDSSILIYESQNRPLSQPTNESTSGTVLLSMAILFGLRFSFFRFIQFLLIFVFVHCFLQFCFHSFSFILSFLYIISIFSFFASRFSFFFFFILRMILEVRQKTRPPDKPAHTARRGRKKGGGGGSPRPRKDTYSLKDC